MEIAIGRIVHVRSNADHCQPAIIVRVWPHEFADGADGVNVLVFRDGGNDNNDGLSPSAVAAPFGQHTAWLTSIREGFKAHEFHDPRECSKAERS